MATSTDILNYSLIPGEQCRNSDDPQPQLREAKPDIKSQEKQEVELKHHKIVEDMRERHNDLHKESQSFKESLDEFKSSIDTILKRKELLRVNKKSQQQQQEFQSLQAQRDSINNLLTSMNNAKVAQDGKQADDEYIVYGKSRVPLDLEVELQLFIAASKIRIAVDKSLPKESDSWYLRKEMRNTN